MYPCQDRLVKHAMCITNSGTESCATQRNLGHGSLLELFHEKCSVELVECVHDIEMSNYRPFATLFGWVKKEADFTHAVDLAHAHNRLTHVFDWYPNQLSAFVDVPCNDMPLTLLEGTLSVP